MVNQLRALFVLVYTDCIRRTWWKIYKKKLEATGREPSGGVPSTDGILEHSTTQMNSKHEDSSHLYITSPAQSVLSQLFLKPVYIYTRDMGTGIRVCNDKSGD